MFVVNVLKDAVDAPDLRNKMRINNPVRTTRNTAFFAIDFHRTNYGQNEIVTRICTLFNNYCNVIDLQLSSDSIRNALSIFFSNNV